MWNGWPATRILYLFLGVVFAAVGLQVWLLHRRQSFRVWPQWLPVIGTGALSVLALLLVVQNSELLQSTFLVAAWLGLAIAAVGVYYHWAGVGNRVGGYTLDNAMVGPPPVLPVMVAALSVLSLIVVWMG